MAEKIDIGAKEVKEEIDLLIKKVVELSNSVANVKKLPFKVTDTSGFNEEISKTTKSLSELEKIEKQVISKREKLALVTDKLYIENQKLSKSITEQNKKIKDGNKDKIRQQDLINRNKAALDKQRKSTLESARSFKILEKNLLDVEKRYKDLAAKQAQGIALTTKEQGKLQGLKIELGALSTAYKKVNTDLISTTGGVRGATSTFDSLGFSIAQITRESPAFLNSMNTGFMAISNNIPTLVDEINKLKKANIELSAQGKPQVNIWKKLGAAIFSWQSLISAGIVLLTAFGPKIIELISNLGDASDEFTKMKKAIESLDDSTIESIGTLIKLQQELNNSNITEQERFSIIQKLNDEYPELISNIQTETDKTKLLNKTVEQYIDNVIKRQQSEKLSNEIGQLALDKKIQEEKAEKKLLKANKEQVEKYKESIDLRVKMIEEDEKSLFATQKLQKLTREYNQSISGITINTRNYIDAKAKQLNTENKISEKTKELLKINKTEVDFVKNSVEHYENLISKNDKIIKQKKTLKDIKEVRRLQEENKEHQKQIDLILNKDKADSKSKSKPKRISDTTHKAEAERLKTLVASRKNEIELENTTNERRLVLAEEINEDLISIANSLQAQRLVNLTNDTDNRKDKLKTDLENSKLTGSELVKLEKSTTAQILAIDQEFENKKKVSVEKGNQDRLAADKYYSSQLKEIRKGELKDAQDKNAADRDREKAAILKKHNDKVESEKLIGEDLKQLEKNTGNEIIKEDIKFLEKQAALFKNIDPKKYNALMLAIQEARKKTTLPDDATDFEKWVNKHEEGLKKIGELFNELSNISNAFTENELQNIEKQREALDEKHESDLEQLEENTEASLEAIAISDESAEEKADKADGIRKSADAEEKRLAKEKEKREEELAKKEAKVKRKQAIIDKGAALANIAINTAVAYTKTLGETGIFGIPLAQLVLALGAAQAATVIATPIPQFAQGGTMTYDGDMMINDGGNQEYVKRDGKILTTTKKNAIVKGKKGDEIMKDKSSLISSFSDNVLKASLLTSLASDNSKNNNTNELVEVFDRNFSKFEKSMSKSVEKGIGNMTINNNNYSSDYANYKASLEQ